jgi:hypothetical protein
MIYANFNLQKIEEVKTSEISVSLIALNGNDNSQSIVENVAAPAPKEPEVKKPEKKIVKEPEKREEKSPTKSVKNQTKPQPKKMAKAKPAEAVAKPVVEKKINEFKKEEKPKEKQEEVKKIKEDKVKNNNEDEVQKEKVKKEKDLGAKEKANEEQKENKPEVTQQTASGSITDVDSVSLSAREKFNLQSQLRRCYKRALDENGGAKNKIKILLQIHVSEEGYIDSNLDEIIDVKLYNDLNNTYYKSAVDNVRRAIELCNPLRNLPLDKYEIWKDESLEFGGEVAEEKKDIDNK